MKRPSAVDPAFPLDPYTRIDLSALLSQPRSTNSTLAALACMVRNQSLSESNPDGEELEPHPAVILLKSDG